MQTSKTNNTQGNIRTVRAALTVSIACAAICITALVAPVQSRDNNSSGKSKKEFVAVDLSDLSRADSGVKLLVGIFNRLGNEPQLALKNDRLMVAAKNKQTDRDMQQTLASNSGAMLNGFSNRNSQFSNAINSQTDPALAIRPRTVSRQTVSEKFIPINGVTIASLPAKKSYYKGSELKESLAEPERKADLSRSEDRKSEADVKDSSRRDEFAAMPAQSTNAPVRMIAGPSSQPAPIADKTYIREFGKLQSGSGGALNSKAESSKAERARSFDDIQKSSRAAETANGIIRPTEQPGLFKYVREHMKDAPKDSPKDLIEVREAANASAAPQGYIEQLASDRRVKTRAGKPSTIVSDNEISLEAQQEGAPLQVAFLPPSTVHGINGLPLGATEADTAKFFKNRGNLTRSFISGWKVWTLLDHAQAPILQVYLRNGRTEAFRIFNQSYVPAGLGVSINDELPSMKGKFGEPAFILEEPGVKPQSPPLMAKNYVYPVSQVSFQLVRSGPSSPQIRSLLLFRYL